MALASKAREQGKQRGQRGQQDIQPRWSLQQSTTLLLGIPFWTPYDLRATTTERWLRSKRIRDVLQHHHEYGLIFVSSPPSRPPPGTLFLYNRKNTKSWRKDGCVCAVCAVCVFGVYAVCVSKPQSNNPSIHSFS